VNGTVLNVDGNLPMDKSDFVFIYIVVALTIVLIFVVPKILDRLT
jgi:hypothetical protein